MSFTKLLTVASISMLATGCIATHVTKEITVTKDASGRVVQTVEKETATQSQSLMPFSLKHLNLK